MTKRTTDVNTLLFDNCVKGDIEKVKDFIKKSDQSIIFAVDDKKKSPLHIAAKEGINLQIKIAKINTFLLK